MTRLDMRFHFSSVLLGFASAVGLLMLLGAGRPVEEFGRFDLEATSNHVFVIDRTTGKVWEKYVTEGGGQSDQDFALPKR